MATRYRKSSCAALVVAATVLIAGAGAAQTPADDAQQQGQRLNAQAVEAYQAGDYAKAVSAAEQATQLARQAFGPRHPNTLTSLSNLAVFYHAQGRYGEAEPLLKEALQGRREILGARHPATLSSLNDLATLYKAQGRYDEAEPLSREALEGRRESLGRRHPKTLSNSYGLAMPYGAQGRYDEAEPLLREALQGFRETLGPRHPDTLVSLNNLAFISQAQGRYGEAGPHLKEALQGYSESLGRRHPNTLSCLNNLAELYRAQGRYGEAETLLKEALEGRREVLGPRHPAMLTSLNNLAALYHAGGRYGEAERFAREALQGGRKSLGPRHPSTLMSLNNLAELYEAQGRYSEAEPLLKEALQGYRETLRPRHPDTLTSLNNLAGLYGAQGRHDEAEPLLREALQGYSESLGRRHPQTLLCLNNLASLYDEQGRYDEAEPLLKEVLQGRRETLPPRHPETPTLNNLAELYRAQGRYNEAEPLYREAVQGSRETLGPRHPNTLATQLNMVWLLASQGRTQEAVRTLQEIEPNLLGRIGQELYFTEGSAVRRQLVSSQADFQDVVLTLATIEAGSDARRLAGTVMLRWKQVQGEEEAYLARLARRSQDPRVRTLADEVGELRSGLAAAARGDAPQEAFETALQALEAKQLELGRVSRDYKDHLRVRTANLDDLRAALPAEAVLIEFRAFQPFDFRAGKLGEPRVAALLLAGFDEPVVADLGPVADMRHAIEVLLGQSSSMPADAAAAALYQRLFAPFESKLAATKLVYLAPDGLLHLVPYPRLKLPNGRYLEEQQEVRLLGTGRDLLRPDPDKPVHGLLALGGIDFGAAAVAAGKPDSVFVTAGQAQDLSGAITRTAESFGKFGPLSASGEEAVQLKDWYLRFRKDESAETWSGASASEARLKALTAPPRVLHLATHGFYLPAPAGAPEPMLLSGVALAGANRALAKEGLFDVGSGIDGVSGSAGHIPRVVDLSRQ